LGGGQTSVIFVLAADGELRLGSTARITKKIGSTDVSRTRPEAPVRPTLVDVAASMIQTSTTLAIEKLPIAR
jgi:hypothetical protein